MRSDPEQILREAEELLEQRHLTAAKGAFDRAELAGADANRCSAGRWMCAMQNGDFEHAWHESDAIRDRGEPDPRRFWQGEDIRGKCVIVRCLHGFGDAVQFLRYAPRIRERAVSLIVEVPPRLMELAPFLTGVEDVITWGEHSPAAQPAWNLEIEVTELPYLFRTQLSDLPIATNYLRLPNSLFKCRELSGVTRNLRVGIAWASGDWKPSRSVPLELLKPLFRTRGCEFWNLQGGAARQEWQPTDCCRMHNDARLCDTVVRLAALIAQLDLVITTDTLAAHLAGALGVPAWVMLEHAADWRWMHKRKDSPWYPSLRLYRQRVQGEWPGLIGRMSEDLARLAEDQQQGRLIA
jgi:hypothetical protein